MSRSILFFSAFFLCGPFSFLTAGQAATDWVSWGGPTGNLTVEDAGAIQPDQAYDLKVIWKKKIGTGYSSVSVRGALAVTMFSDGAFDYVIALDANDGSERWQYKIGPAYLGHYGSQSGPLSTPVLTEDLVIALSAQGRLIALDANTGGLRWSVDLPIDHGAIAPFRGFTSSPRLHKGMLILQLGGTRDNAIAAFEPTTGARLWAAHSDSVDYQSPGLFTIAGQEQVVFHGNRTLAGLSPQTGRVLWQFNQGGQTSASATSGHPVEVGEGRYFVKNRVDGGILVQVHERDGAYTVEEVWKSRHFGRTYIYPVYYDGFLFGKNGRTLICMDVKTGERVWRSREPGDGLPIVVDGNLVIVTKEGVLALARASGEGYDERARVDLFDDIV